MNKATLLFSLPLLIAGASPPVEAQDKKSSPANNQAEIDRINVYENAAKYSFFSHLLAIRRVVKDSPMGKWYETSPRTKRYFLAADLGTHNGKLALVYIGQPLITSGRSDSSFLLFRPDGTLAKYTLIAETWAKGKFVKSAGKFQYFSPRGELLLTISASKNNKTGEINAAPHLSSPHFPIYKNTSALPFYNLLKTRIRTPIGKPIV